MVGSAIKCINIGKTSTCSSEHFDVFVNGKFDSDANSRIIREGLHEKERSEFISALVFCFDIFLLVEE